MITTQACPALPTERESEYVLSPDVILVHVDDGSARLLDMAGKFHAVPPVGARMLQELLRSGTDATVARMAEEHGVAREQVATDLAVFLGDLKSQGLLCRQRHRRREGAARVARLMLGPALYAAHRFLRSPAARARAFLALARLSFPLFGWTATVAAWQQAHARFPRRRAGAPDASVVQELDTTMRAAVAGHPLAVACKERAFCAWSLARAAGLDASLVVGIGLFPMAAHCWCEVGAQPLGDDREWCINFMPVGRW